jgi:hypothetical protein
MEHNKQYNICLSLDGKILVLKKKVRQEFTMHNHKITFHDHLQYHHLYQHHDHLVVSDPTPSVRVLPFQSIPYGILQNSELATQPQHQISAPTTREMEHFFVRGKRPTIIVNNVFLLYIKITENALTLEVSWLI